MAPSIYSSTDSYSQSHSDDFDLISSQEASLDPKALQTLQSWLQPTDYNSESSEFHRHLSSQAPDTGLWICDTDRYRQWHDSDDHGSLWIKGVPGAGKSVIAASMVDHLKRTEEEPVLFFFFRYILVANRRPRSLVRDWLAQLLPHSLRLQATLQPMLAYPLEDLSDERLWEHLLTGLASLDKAYCVVDALDEMEFVPDDSFLGRLNKLATFRPGNVKLLMTSRPKQYLQSSVRDASIVHISLEDDLVGKDIAHFVSHRLKMATSGSYDHDVCQSLANTICTRSRGLFLYARLLLDQITPILQQPEKKIDVERLAKSLPIGLEDMYNSMLLQQAESLKIDAAIQVFLLGCAVHSSRNLRLNELANAIQFKFPSSMIPGTPKAIARTACAPLLEIMEDETVQVIHHSFTEFLLDQKRVTRLAPTTATQFPPLDPQTVHRMMAMTCLKYLQSGVLKSETLIERHLTYADENEDEDSKPETKIPDYDYQQTRLQNPFLEYSAQNWDYHASKYDIKDDAFFSAIESFTKAEPEFRQWLSLVKNNRYLNPKTEAPTLLHVAAFAGLTNFAGHLLQAGHVVDFRDVDQATPLIWASSSGYVEIAALLLNHGAEPDVEDHFGTKPIHFAAKRNHHGIVKLLLDSGVDPLSPKTKDNILPHGRIMGGQQRTKGDTAVRYACQQGHTETIKVMLPFLEPETLEEVFCESCRYGKYEAVRALLENPSVSVDSKFTGATAIYLACIANSIDCVQLLLQRGADIAITSEWKPSSSRYGPGGRRGPPNTPLQVLVREWSVENDASSLQIFQMLMNAGADLHQPDGDGKTPILTLFGYRQRPSNLAIRSLLEAGAKTSDRYEDGNTILNAFLDCNRDLEILNLLLDYGADVNAVGSHETTVLESLLRAHTPVCDKNTLKEMVEFLLEKGAPVHIEGSSVQSALHVAMSSHCELDVFKLLFEACTDESIQNNCIWLIGGRYGPSRIDFIRFLQSAGISLESRNSRHETVLLATMRSNIWKPLVECGARLDVTDSRGRGPLHLSISQYSHATTTNVQELVAAGVDPFKVDDEGNTILHLAATQYQGQDDMILIEYLIKLGLSVNAKNKKDRTPLHCHIEDAPESLRNFSSNEKPRTALLELFRKFSDDLDVNMQADDGLTPLHLCAMRSELDVARLLDTGADVGLLTIDKRTALHLACRARRSEVVALLLDKMTPELINHRDRFGRTALFDACASGRPESVYLLLKYGVDVTTKDLQDHTPLHTCAEFQSEQSIYSLLGIRNNPWNLAISGRYRPRPYGSSRTGNSWYSSKYASFPTYSDHDTVRIATIVSLLLEAGAGATALDKSKHSPLQHALDGDCKEMVRALAFTAEEVQKGFDKAENGGGFSTEVALNSKMPVTLWGHSDPTRNVLLAHPTRYINQFCAEDVEWLIKNKANFVNGDGDKITVTDSPSYIHIAANNGLTELIEPLGELATYYDDPHIVKSRLNKISYSKHYLEKFAPVLHSACERDLPNLQMIESLVEKCGVDVNGRALIMNTQYGKLDKNAVPGPTALHVLAQSNHWWNLQAIRYLVEHGADIDSRDEYGETPLHVACAGKKTTDFNKTRRPGFWSPDCVSLLLDLGADPNALDSEGKTPLNAEETIPKSMKILLSRGADISAGKISPLISAIQSQNLGALSILLDAGVDPNAKDVTKSYHIHYQVKDQERWILFCAAFPYILNLRIEDSAPLAKLLLERGADSYKELSSTETLLHYVFEHAEYEIAGVFMECKDQIDFERRDQLGRTVLLAACNNTRGVDGPRAKKRARNEQDAETIQAHIISIDRKSVV